MTKKILFGLILTACCTLVSAQDSSNDEKDRQYVTDQLRLSLYEEANSQSRVLKLLRSGDEVIIDEIKGPYALVTGPDGTHGWVKRGFLVTTPTSNILLREEREKNASLFEEIEKLSNSKVVIDTYEKDMNELVAKIEKLESEKKQVQREVVEIQQEADSTQLRLEQRLQNNLPPIIVLRDTLLEHWKIILPLILALMALCFLITKILIETRIKSKFHGIKIW